MQSVGSQRPNGLSIVIPSGGTATSLLESIRKQTLASNKYEVLLYSTKQDLIFEYSKIGANIQAFHVGVKQTNKARNIGASAAQYSQLLFLDDDCILPDDNFLERIYKKSLTTSYPISGFYTSVSRFKPWQLIYNTISNAWLIFHSRHSNSVPVFLGGFLTLPTDLFLQTKGFNENINGFNEELDVSFSLFQMNQPVYLNYDWNVKHDYNKGFIDLINSLITKVKNRDQRLCSKYAFGLKLSSLFRGFMKSFK